MQIAMQRILHNLRIRIYLVEYMFYFRWFGVRTRSERVQKGSGIARTMNGTIGPVQVNTRTRTLKRVRSGPVRVWTMVQNRTFPSLVTPTDPFLAPPSSLSNTSCLPAEPYAMLIPQGSDVAPMNMAKQALELSPGPKLPSAVHTQKRSKDSLMVPGKKPIGPSMCLDREYSTCYEV